MSKASLLPEDLRNVAHDVKYKSKVEDKQKSALFKI